jgi:hypothetical protein
MWCEIRVLAAERPARPEPTMITGGRVAILSLLVKLSLDSLWMCGIIRYQGEWASRSGDGGLIVIR